MGLQLREAQSKHTNPKLKQQAKKPETPRNSSATCTAKEAVAFNVWLWGPLCGYQRFFSWR
jgi:hypothetical protein